jgi:hypothetical protein
MKFSDLWGKLKFDKTSTALEKSPPVTETPDEAKKPCLLLRGQENLLARIWTEEKPEITDEVLSDIRQEVRALCAQWLKMQNVNALIGAGASKYVTGFIGRELYEQVVMILADRASRKTLEEILTLAGNPEDVGVRFEEFLSQLTNLVTLLRGESGPLAKVTHGWSLGELGTNEEAATRLQELLLDIERAIIVSCNVTLRESELMLSPFPITPHEAFLAKLVSRDPQQGRALLFTPNYDTLLEQAMDRLGIMYADGFTGTILRRFNPACYDIDLYYPGEVAAGRVQRYDKVLHLYKIHGSIHWRRSAPQAGDPFGILFDSQPLPSREKVRAAPEVLDEVLSPPASGEARQGLAILPTASKFGETISMPYAHLFRAMAQALREPQTASFVIGYSGWDQHINRIIEDSLTNPGFTCVIINPTLSDWARKLASSDYSGRVYAFSGDWATFEFFALQMLPDLEILKTDLAIARTLRDLQKTRIQEHKDSSEKD